MQVVETFTSINGEGVRAGETAVFVRFRGCNLCCSYCDTMWANEAGCSYNEMPAEEIDQFVRSTGIVNVTLTGGEPLIQDTEEMKRLLSRLLRDGKLRVEIETNGSIDLTPFCGQFRPVFTMDWKLPSSGQEASMRSRNISLLKKEDTVKFVCGSQADLSRAAELIREYALTEVCHVYMSPVFGAIRPEEIVGFLLDNRMNDVRLQLQIHKLIWDPDRRGV
ncbi:MAG: putative 7-carboxy-7-deazaguanine synthase QueE [Firmicutes bacterium]|nr:putative 7-carboxy-7-deazaguanine synthase QueE [Bacillota bacterium]